MSDASDFFDIALDTLELSQMGAAQLLGCNERTIRHWVSDRKAPHYAMLVLMLMYHHGHTPEDIRDIEQRVSRKWFGKR